MSELKPCPFCGSPAYSYHDNCIDFAGVKCDLGGCVCADILITENNWNTRPVEDALTARIAELEAEVTELKPYRDGYDPEEVFPPEGEWVWLRDCDDDIEPVQYDHKAEIYWNYGMNADGVEFTYWERNNGDLRRWYPISPLPTLPEVQE